MMYRLGFGGTAAANCAPPSSLGELVGYQPAPGCGCPSPFFQGSNGQCVNNGPDGPPCPSGFTVNPATGICLNAAGQTPSAANNQKQNGLGYAMLAGSLGVLIFAPGASKLLALPLGYFGFVNILAGLAL